jgi:hypothetical protein
VGGMLAVRTDIPPSKVIRKLRREVELAMGGKVIFMLPLYILLVILHTKQRERHVIDFTAHG